MWSTSCVEGTTGDPREPAVLAAMLHRAVLRAEAWALATGETVEALHHMAALLDTLAAEESAAWLALGASMAAASGERSVPPAEARRRPVVDPVPRCHRRSFDRGREVRLAG